MKRLIGRLFKSDFIKNTGWIVFAQIYQMAIQLIIGVISARYLGPSNYGTINYAASYISFFTIACALGLEGIVVKEMVADREKEGVVLGSSIAYRFTAGILSMFAVCLIVYAVNPGDQVLLVIAFLQSLALLFTAFHIIEMWYQSMMRSKVASIVKCVSYTVMSVYKVFLLVAGKSVEWFAFATSLDALLIAVFYLVCYRKQGTHPLKIDRKVGNQLIKLSYHLIISSLMAVIYNQMDRLMIGKMLGQTEVGYYAAATTIAHMWMFIPQAFTNSARPLIMELKNRDEGLYHRRTFQLAGFLFWMGVVFAIFITMFSHYIVDTLYGVEYSAARGPLLINIWGMVFSCLSYPRSVWMICEDKQRYAKKILLWGVVVNLILNSVLIPIIGINGAAFATLVTEMVSCLVAPMFYKDTRPFVISLIKSFAGKF